MSKYAASYLFCKKKVIGIYLLILAVFRLVFYLYGIDWDAVSYAFILIAVFWIMAGMIDFLISYRRYRELMEAEAALPGELRELPQAKSAEEALYQSALKELFSEKKTLESEMRIGRKDMLDYYSLWVHQIKTPISAMHLLLQSMEETDTALLQEMKMELFKTEQYVELVLSYLRMEDMSSDLVLKWYPMDSIVRQAIRKYAQMFILKKIRLDYRPSQQKILTDEKWLLLVLEQVLSNALKYTREGEISIYTSEADPGTLVIADTGIGIQKEDIPRVFEKGFTGYNGRQDKKSTGIGLYLCRQICLKLGHHISLDSEIGKGTKVFLKLSRRELRVE